MTALDATISLRVTHQLDTIVAKPNRTATVAQVATISLIQSDGLLILFPIAVVEGPIITVIAAYVASLGYLNLPAVFCVVVAADLVGDIVLYHVGRSWHLLRRLSWMPRFGVNEARLLVLENHFERHGPKTLLIGKLTHSAGFLVLIAAGASRMPFGAFLWYNLLGTLPKSLFFLILGYAFGYAYNEIDSYIFRVSAAVLLVVVLVGAWWLARRNRGTE